MTVFEVVYEYRAAYASGLLVTLQLCAIAWATGLLCGGGLALAAEWRPRVIGVPITALSRISEAIPILVLLFWLHYPAQAAFGIVVDPFYTTAFLLSFLNTLAVYGILTRAMSEVPANLIEIATVCGISRSRAFWHVKLPLGTRYAIGSLCTAQINILQLSIFGGLIAVEELFRVSQRINSQVYQPVAVYSGLALFFLALCLPLNLMSRFLSRRMHE